MVGSDVIVQHILPMVLEMSRDSVANVRFNVAKTLDLLMKHVSDKNVVNTQIIPVLNSLNEDSDRDVKYFAQKALVSGMYLANENVHRQLWLKPNANALISCICFCVVYYVQLQHETHQPRDIQS